MQGLPLNTWQCCVTEDGRRALLCDATHLCEGDIVMLADIQGPTELEGLHQQLHSLLMLLMLQEEISCITTLLLSLWSDIMTLAVAKC